MALWIRSDGSERLVTPEDPPLFSLKEMRAYVGGHIELVRLPGSRLLWVNEEGRLLELPLNRTASALAGMVIVGDVLMTDPGEVD